MLADSPDENNGSNCFPVFLEKNRGGLPLREVLNLYDQPEFLGRYVEIYGNLETYLGVNGIKKIWNVTVFVPSVPT